MKMTTATALKKVAKWMSRKAIFLDRDNTIIRDDGYFHDPNTIVFLPGVIDGLLRLQEAGFLFFIVTNQSGVGRGYFPESDVVAVHKKIIALLHEQGVLMRKIYYCPHAPEENCPCRKPKPFLILRAAKEFDIDLAKSFFIGNHVKDMEAGHAAGTMTVFIGTPERSPIIDFEAQSFVEATEKIISYEKLRDAI
jgi:D-glycero-D-manno-heptose 1,7-bisphosphate phosphatase